MINYIKKIIVIGILIFAVPVQGMIVQTGSDALFFDMMGTGGGMGTGESYEKVKKKPTDSKNETITDEKDFNGEAYKEFASKFLENSSAKIPLVSLDSFNNKQELNIPSGKTIEFQITEKANIHCYTEVKDTYLKFEKKSKKNNIVSYFYNTLKTGTTIFYIDCIDSNTKETDSKIIFMTVR